MPGISIDALDGLAKDLETVLKESKEMRRELHEEIADVLKETLDANIDAGLNDGNGHVKAMQEKHVGSGGGYAAVRPKKGKNDKGLAYGTLTNYLEIGHRIRPPSGTYKRYRPRIKVAYVNGRHFYQTTRGEIEAKVIGLVEQFADRIAEKLEG